MIRLRIEVTKQNIDIATEMSLTVSGWAEENGIDILFEPVPTLPIFYIDFKNDEDATAFRLRYKLQ